MALNEQVKIILYHHSCQDKVRLETRVGTRAMGHRQVKVVTPGTDHREAKEDIRISDGRAVKKDVRKNILTDCLLLISHVGDEVKLKLPGFGTIMEGLTRF
jgi:hypothetical protein